MTIVSSTISSPIQFGATYRLTGKTAKAAEKQAQVLASYKQVNGSTAVQDAATVEQGDRYVTYVYTDEGQGIDAKAAEAYQLYAEGHQESQSDDEIKRFTGYEKLQSALLRLAIHRDNAKSLFIAT